MVYTYPIDLFSGKENDTKSDVNNSSMPVLQLQPMPNQSDFPVSGGRYSVSFKIIFIL